jgi:hypothetical protein
MPKKLAAHLISTLLGGCEQDVPVANPLTRFMSLALTEAASPSIQVNYNRDSAASHIASKDCQWATSFVEAQRSGLSA